MHLKDKDVPVHRDSPILSVEEMAAILYPCIGTPDNVCRFISAMTGTDGFTCSSKDTGLLLLHY